MTDLAQLLAWIVAANTIVNFATTVYTLLSSRATKALKAIEDLNGKITALGEERQKASEAGVTRFQGIESRLLRIEADMEHLPDREHAHRMELAIERLDGRMKTLDASMTGSISTMDERLKPIAYVARRLQELEFEKAAEK